jgi:hypothetical protein
MASSDGQSKWTDRLVPVPLWYLLAGGGGVIVGDNVIDAFMETQTAQATPVAAPVDASIAAKLDELQASQARMEGRLISLERTAGELQQDMKTIKLAIR